MITVVHILQPLIFIESIPAAEIFYFLWLRNVDCDQDHGSVAGPLHQLNIWVRRRILIILHRSVRICWNGTQLYINSDKMRASGVDPKVEHECGQILYNGVKCAANERIL